jgi:serine O-acetyltransferase
MMREIRGDLRRHGLGGGFFALCLYRYGRWSLTLPFAPARWATSKIYGMCRPVVQHLTGVDLDRTTKVGEALHIVHGGMISIHPDVVIGDRVGIMHGVTLGTNMGTHAPVIGDDVFIGCHASVLGGVRIGRGARIAANSLVISDVPSGAMAVGVPARIGPDVSGLRKTVRPLEASSRASPEEIRPRAEISHGRLNGKADHGG